MTPSTSRHRIVLVAAGTGLLMGLAGCSDPSPRHLGPGGTAASTVGSPSVAAHRPSAAAQAEHVGPAAKKLDTDWPTYHHDALRTGTSDTIGRVHSTPTRIWNVQLDGAVYASPIVAEGAKIFVTENNTIYRIHHNEIVWKHHVGAPVPQSSLPCGNIDPSGITGTPAYDAATSTVVFVALLDNPIRHVAYGYDPLTGKKRWERAADVPAGVSGITPDAMQQRGALLVHGRRVFIPYGGLAGDCSTYRGSVVGVDLDHPVHHRRWHFTIPTSREAGIWAPAGATDSPVGHGILIAAGNGATAGTGHYDYSDSVLRLFKEKIRDHFSPSTWRTDNRDDLDLGSQGPTVVGKYIFIAGKSGTAYTLRQSDLGGVGGEVHHLDLCSSFGGTAVSGSTVYVPCSDGVRAVHVGKAGRLTVLWHAATSTAGSPVLGGGRLWTLDSTNGVLYGLDPETGAVRSSNDVGSVTRFATPALWQNSIFVPTLTGVVAFHWT